MVEVRKLIKLYVVNGTPVKASAELLSANLTEIKKKHGWGGIYQFCTDNSPIDIEAEAHLTLNDLVVLSGQSMTVTLIEPA